MMCRDCRSCALCDLQWLCQILTDGLCSKHSRCENDWMDESHAMRPTDNWSLMTSATACTTHTQYMYNVVLLHPVKSTVVSSFTSITAERDATQNRRRPINMRAYRTYIMCRVGRGWVKRQTDVRTYRSWPINNAARRTAPGSVTV